MNPWMITVLEAWSGPRRLWRWMVAVGIAAISVQVSAQTAEVPWRYTLISGSALTDDCAICGRPTLVLPMRGTFELQLVEENPLFAVYALGNVDFTAGWEGGPRYRLTGRGEYQVGGEVAITQKLTLQLMMDDGQVIKEVAMASEHGPVERPWPMVLAAAKQTNGTPLQQLDVVMAAAPFRELWFSTTHGMTAGTTPPPFEVYRRSELLTLGGRRVKTNGELTQRLGLMPMAPDIGLDAVDVWPGGEIAFSSTEAVFSESLGPLKPGDILSDQGKLLKSHDDLILPFAPRPPTSDSGLDAIHQMENGVIAFSLTGDLYSETLRQKVGKGDLLSSAGAVLKTNKELLARFHPIADDGTPVGDLGLDALYVWPSGEIWFSTETGFQDRVLGPVRGGDVLSDGGYVVFGNLDLVSAFSPLEDLADFGLDGLVVVTDTLVPVPPPVVTGVELRPPTAGLQLDWTGAGRFSQVWGAPSVGGPYTPFAPIQTDQHFEKDQWIQTHPDYFFKIRQW